MVLWKDSKSYKKDLVSNLFYMSRVQESYKEKKYDCWCEIWWKVLLTKKVRQDDTLFNHSFLWKLKQESTN